MDGPARAVDAGYFDVAVLEVRLDDRERHRLVGLDDGPSRATAPAAGLAVLEVAEEQGKDSEATFVSLIREYFGGSIRGPFNLPARFQAGFTREEMDALSQ